MDYIREFDIKLEKEMFYAGEILAGFVILDTIENFKLRAIRVVLRGKAHTEWKVMVSGERRTVKDDQYFIDDRAMIWGKDKADGNVQILPRGLHKFPFRFQLPESSLPYSFESKCGTIRYYIKVTVDIPYASPPQGMKYFTIIGPHIDCMDDIYLKPIMGERRRPRFSLCWDRRRVTLRTKLDRSAYVCGESLRVKADIDNQSDEEARLKLRLVQYVEYYIDRGVLGVSKEVSHTIFEYRGAPVQAHSRTKWDSQQNLVVPTMPPTLIGVCRLIQLYYVLKVSVELEKSGEGESLNMHFPITIATVPFRIPNSNQQPVIQYEVACDHAEGGMYIGPEFQLGQVYDGSVENGDTIVLYRPVYLSVVSQGKALKSETPTSMNRNAVMTLRGDNGSGGGSTGGGGGASGVPSSNQQAPNPSSRTNSSSNLIKQNSKSDNIRNNISGGSGGSANISKLPGKDHINSSSFDKDSNTTSKGNVITSADSSVTSVPPV